MIETVIVVEDLYIWQEIIGRGRRLKYRNNSNITNNLNRKKSLVVLN